MRAKPPLSLRARALAWLARREHSRAELKRKLIVVARADGREAEVEPLLQWLEAERHLSNDRFAESRVHARAARLGLRRIESELRENGLDLPAAARAELAAGELQRAREVWRRKFGAPPATPGERARQQRFLLGRGFAPDVVHRTLGSGRDGPDD